MRQILTNNTIGFEYGYKLNIINTKREVGLRNNNYVNQLPFFLSFYLYMSYTGKHIKASVSLYSFIPKAAASQCQISVLAETYCLGRLTPSGIIQSSIMLLGSIDILMS